MHETFVPCPSCKSLQYVVATMASDNPLQSAIAVHPVEERASCGREDLLHLIELQADKLWELSP
jgi:hypothetical protein